MNEQTAINSILELESARCRALVDKDLGALSDLVDDSLIHIHATGKVDSKQEYLQLVESALNFLTVSRDDLRVRVHGEVAVLTGRLTQHIEFCNTGERLKMAVFATQIWLRRDDTWRQISFQATHL